MLYMIEGFLLVNFTLLLWMMLRPTMTVKDKRELGVRGASPVYSDEKGTKMLNAPKLMLKGKPDYIFETWLLKRYIPLEIKSGKLKEEVPHQGDLYQLVAYFLLVEEAYGKRPPYGKLVYANKTFKVRNTARLRREVKHVMAQMRQMLAEEYMPEASPDFMKCKNCVCRDTVCQWTKGD